MQEEVPSVAPSSSFNVKEGENAERKDCYTEDRNNVKSPYFSLICAMDGNRGIGWRNGLPWPHHRTDREFYIKTVETPSIPADSAKSLRGRPELTTLSSVCPPYVYRLARSFSDALKVACSAEVRQYADDICVIGGESVYQVALKSPLCKRVYLTRIHHSYQCDTFIPPFEKDFCTITDPDVADKLQEEDGIKFQIQVYERKGTTVTDSANKGGSHYLDNTHGN